MLSISGTNLVWCEFGMLISFLNIKLESLLLSTFIRVGGATLCIFIFICVIVRV